MFKLLGNILVFVLCTASYQSLGQIDARLVSHFGQDYIQSLGSKDVAYLEFYLNESYYVQDLTEKDLSDVIDAATVGKRTKGKSAATEFFDPELFSKETFNPWAYNFQQYPDRRSYYKLGESGMVLCFYSHQEIQSKFNKYWEEINNQ